MLKCWVLDQELSRSGGVGRWHSGIETVNHRGRSVGIEELGLRKLPTTRSGLDTIRKFM